jgi:parvulin-like peptidyl-prolyl isomerase
MDHRVILKNKPTDFYEAVFLLLGAASLFFVFGCDRRDLNSCPVVMVVGDQRLTADVLKKDLVFATEDLPISTRDAKQVKSRLLDHIIDRYLMLEYARQNDIIVSEDEFQAHLNEIKEGYSESHFEELLLRKSGDPEAWEKRLREQLVIERVIKSVTKDMAPPDHKEMMAYFESAPNRFKAPDRVKFRQIFCGTRKQARQLHARIRAGESLADLAREYSEGPEAENGGEVGWITKGTLDKTLDKTLFSLAPGDLSPVTKGPSGYHIFETVSRRPAGFQAFSEVIGDIEQTLIEQKRESFCRKWLQNLRTDIRVKINQKEMDTLEFS